MTTNHPTLKLNIKTKPLASNLTKSNLTKATVSIKQPSKKHFIDPAEYNRLLKLVQEKYPVTFPVGPDIKILAIGIHIELAEQLDIPKTLARKFLRKYCVTKQYREAAQPHTKRYNLAGDVVGEVTEEQVNLLKTRRKDFKAK